MTGRAIPWTPEQDDILRRLSATTPDAELGRLCGEIGEPRTARAVKHRRSRLGVRCGPGMCAPKAPSEYGRGRRPAPKLYDPWVRRDVAFDRRIALACSGATETVASLTACEVAA